jgi:hypothetical protein
VNPTGCFFIPDTGMAKCCTQLGTSLVTVNGTSGCPFNAAFDGGANYTKASDLATQCCNQTGGMCRDALSFGC